MSGEAVMDSSASPSATGAAAPAESITYPNPAMGWLTVAVLFVLYILSLTDRNIMSLVIEPLKADLNLTDFQISLLQGVAFALCYCFAAIPMGLALDRYSRRIVLFLSVIGWSLAACLCGAAASFVALFIARGLVGVGESGFSTGAYSIVGDSFPPEKVSLAMAVFIMGGVMGAGIVLLIGGPIVAAAIKGGPSDWPILGTIQPWQEVFLITGLPGLLLAFTIFFFPEPPRRKVQVKQAGYGEAFAYIRANPLVFVAAFAGVGLVYSATIGFQFWTPSVLMRTRGWDAAQVGAVIGPVQIAAAALMPAHGWIIGRLQKSGRADAPLLWSIITCGLAIPLGVATFSVESDTMTVVFFGLFMVCILSVAAIGPALVQIISPPHLRGRISAIQVFSVGIISYVAGPMLVGSITDHVLKDPMKIGTSLISTMFIELLPAVLLFWAGRAGMRALLAKRAAEA